MNKQEHISWIDIAKAITIFLVVFGHTMRDGSAQKIVYSFHVALFFFISGITCKTNNLKQRILNDIKRIMVPYYCFGLVSIAIFALLGNFAASKFDVSINTSLSDNILNLLFATDKYESLKFNTPLWFLPCLFITKMMYYALSKLLRNKTPYVFISSVFICTLGFIYSAFSLPVLPFSLVIAVKMLPFFSAGRIFLQYIRSCNPKLLCKSTALCLGSALLVITGVIAYFSPKVNYSGDIFPNILAFAVTASLGSLGVCLLSMGISHNKILQYVGQNTLAILVMHKFPILVFQTIGPMESLLQQYDSPIGNLLGGVPVSIIAIAMCLVAAIIINKILPFLLGNNYTKRENKT